MAFKFNAISGTLDIVADTAIEISITDSGDYYSGTEVETALQEIGDGTTLDTRYVNVTGDTMTGTLQINVPTTTSQALILKTTDDNATKNIFEVRNSAGTPRFWIIGNASSMYLSDGNAFAWGDGSTSFFGNSNTDLLTLRTSAANRFRIIADGSVGINQTSPGATLEVKTLSSSHIGQIIKAAASQTANLQEWQNSGGTVLAYINPTGGALFGDKVSFTQTDGNEAIDSLADGYMDYLATTAHRFNAPVNITGSISTTVPLGYAEMYMYGNTTAVIIDNADVYHAVYNTFGNNDATLAPLRDTTSWTYTAGATYAITSVTDPSGETTITCVTAGHSLLAGEPITITGSSVAGYNGTYVVLAAGLTATDFRVTVAYSDTATASARKPATMQSLVTGYYKCTFTVSGTVANPNDNVKVEINRDMTPLDNIGARGLWTNTKYSSLTGAGLVSVTAGQYIWMSTKNYSGAADITFYSGNISLHRII